MTYMDELYLSRSKLLFADVRESEIAKDDYETLQNVIMGTKVEKIVAKPPFKVLTNIIGEPDYGTTNRMVQDLYGNTEMIPTTLEGGKPWHIGIITRLLLYTILSQTTYIAPEDLGATPNAITWL